MTKMLNKKSWVFLNKVMTDNVTNSNWNLQNVSITPVKTIVLVLILVVNIQLQACAWLGNDIDEGKFHWPWRVCFTTTAVVSTIVLLASVCRNTSRFYQKSSHWVTIGLLFLLITTINSAHAYKKSDPISNPSVDFWIKRLQETSVISNCCVFFFVVFGGITVTGK